MPEVQKRTRCLMQPRAVIAPTAKFPASAAMVRQIRYATCLSQAQFAKKAKINRRTLQNWEIGRTRPNDEGWEKLNKMKAKK